MATPGGPPDIGELKTTPDLPKPAEEGLPNAHRKDGDKVAVQAADVIAKFHNEQLAKTLGEARELIGANPEKINEMAAYSRAGISSENLVSDAFVNISPGLTQPFVAGRPQLFREIGDDLFIIKDEDAFISMIKGLYREAGDALHPGTELLIRSHLKNAGKFAIAAGIPGLHAEVRAINWLFHNSKSGMAARIPKDVGAYTIKLGKKSSSGKQGGHFKACSNCGGILDESWIWVLTGRRGVR